MGSVRIHLVILAVVMMSAGVLCAASFQDIIDQGKVPQPRYLRMVGVPAPITVLDLSGFNLDSWEGFENIPLEGIQVLRLNDNQFDAIPAKVFKKNKHAKNLRALNLSRNKINSIQPRSLEGLDKLWVLLVNDNDIGDIARSEREAMPRRLKLLSINDNPVSASLESARALQKKFPRAFIWNAPLTKDRLKKVGIVAVALTGIIIAAIGVKGYVSLEESAKEKSSEKIRIDAFRKTLEKYASDESKQKQLDYFNILPREEQLKYIELPQFLGVAMTDEAFSGLRPSFIYSIWRGLFDYQRRKIRGITGPAGIRDAIYQEDMAVAVQGGHKSVKDLDQGDLKIINNRLDLQGKGLTSVKGLDEIENKYEVEEIFLQDNELEDIPTRILNAFPNLKELAIVGNRFLPGAIEDLTKYCNSRDIRLFASSQKE